MPSQAVTSTPRQCSRRPPLHAAGVRRRPDRQCPHQSHEANRQATIHQLAERALPRGGATGQSLVAALVRRVKSPGAVRWHAPPPLPPSPPPPWQPSRPPPPPSSHSQAQPYAAPPSYDDDRSSRARLPAPHCQPPPWPPPPPVPPAGQPPCRLLLRVASTLPP